MKEVLILLSPRWKKFRNRLKSSRKEKFRALFILGLIMGLWAVIYLVFVKALAHFTSEEMFGTVAAVKVLSMILMTFAFVVTISSIITVFSTFFLSEELQLLLAGPAPAAALYTARFTETLIDSSWMALIFGLPIFLAYGRVFSAPWTFYVLSLAGFFSLLVITTALAVFVVQVLVKTFPVRRLRDLFVLAGLLLFVGIYLLFRMLRPEELLNPEGFASAMDYFSIVSEPSSPLLPTSWIVEMLRPYLTGYGFEHRMFFLVLLVTAATAAFRLVGHYHESAHFVAYTKAFEAKGARLSRNRLIGFMEKVLRRFLDRPTAGLVCKETLLVVRDSSRISQMLLLIALIVVYLYNFSVLPSLDSAMATFFLKNGVAFLNIGLAGFVLASLGVRFLFPAVSSEGRAFWILKGAPIGLRKVFWVKFAFYLAPMVFLGLFLVMATNRLLGLDSFMFIVSTVTVLLLTAGLTALSMGMGVLYADFNDVDPARAVTSSGALLTMVYAGLAVAAVIILEVFPVYRVLTSQYFGRGMGLLDYLLIGACFAGALAITVALIVKPLRMGLNRITELEI